MDALIGIYKKVSDCLRKHNVKYEALSISVADGITIIAHNNRITPSKVSKVSKCLDKELPPAWRSKVYLEVKF